MQSDCKVGIEPVYASDVAIRDIGAECGSALRRDYHRVADGDHEAVYYVEGHAGAAELERWTDVVPRHIVTEYVATAPLQRTGNRFFRLTQRAVGAIPLQPPTVPLLEFSEFGTTPIGATGITAVAWREIPGSLTDELETQIRSAAQQNSLVRSWLGPRYAYIDTSPLEMPKGATNMFPGQPLQSRVTFFSHSFNWAVLADMNGTNVVGATNSTTLQPPEGADEVAAALALARSDPRLAGTVQGLIGGGLLISIATPGQPGFGHRVIHVGFSLPDEAVPRYAALVDLTLQEVIHVSTP